MYLLNKVINDNSTWENIFLDKLAFELKISNPNQKGFCIRNLKYMKTFYNEYLIQGRVRLLEKVDETRTLRRHR